MQKQQEEELGSSRTETQKLLDLNSYMEHKWRLVSFNNLWRNRQVQEVVLFSSLSWVPLGSLHQGP